LTIKQAIAYDICKQQAEGEKIMVTRPEKKRRSWALLLLLLPFIVLLIPPIYNHTDPELIGIPFFYWFQLLVIVLTAILTAALYFAGA